MNILPTSWNNAISEYLPSNAGADIFSLTHGPHDLAPWPGFGLFCAYTAFGRDRRACCSSAATPDQARSSTKPAEAKSPSKANAS